MEELPVRDVSERPGVYQGGAALQGLHQVGLEGVFQQHGHGPGCL